MVHFSSSFASSHEHCSIFRCHRLVFGLGDSLLRAWAASRIPWSAAIHRVIAGISCIASHGLRLHSEADLLAVVCYKWQVALIGVQKQLCNFGRPVWLVKSVTRTYRIVWEGFDHTTCHLYRSQFLHNQADCQLIGLPHMDKLQTCTKMKVRYTGAQK